MTGRIHKQPTVLWSEGLRGDRGGPWGTVGRSDRWGGCGVEPLGGTEARAPEEAPASDGSADTSFSVTGGRVGNWNWVQMPLCLWGREVC